MCTFEDHWHSWVYVPAELAGLGRDHTETLYDLGSQGRVLGPKAGHDKRCTILKRDMKGLFGTIRIAPPLIVTVAQYKTTAGAKRITEHLLLHKRLGSRIDGSRHLGIFYPRGHKSPGQWCKARTGIGSAYHRGLL